MSINGPGRAEQLDALLAEQIAYYRAQAPDYGGVPMEGVSDAEMVAAEKEFAAALRSLGPLGDTLELACGPGTWTQLLLESAERVTAVDSSPEMLELAGARVAYRRAQFIEADIFSWKPDHSYDFVFFGFWLSHVPLERFEQFWSTVAAALRPGGRVCFIDDGFRTPEELIAGPHSSTIRRQVADGREFRAVKVPYEPEMLEQRLSAVGWTLRVQPLPGPFFWGLGKRA